MNVLMVTPSYYPIIGGAERIIQSLSTQLNRSGIPTDVMTFNMDVKWKPAWRAKTEKIDGVKVFKIPAMNWLPMTYSDRIKLRINLIPGRFWNRLRAYDIIHFHDGGDLSFAAFSFPIKKPKILHFHGWTGHFYKRYSLGRYMLRHLADLYISPARFIETELIKVGIPKHKIRPLPNGPIDVNIFGSSGKKIDNLILFVGRISFQKGLHVLLESLKNFEESVHLVIIGPFWDVEYSKKMLELIDKENKKGIHKITYLGAQNHTDVIKWYQKASVFILPSLIEGGGIVNLEALSCETPVVATNVGGVSEFVRDGENGLLVPPNNPEKMAEAVKYLLDNEDVRIKFGREGRKWVVKHFSLEVVMDRLCRIYKEIIDLNCRM